ncbi:hypothetical protein [Aminobacter ciceronei]|uniref:hypothetical protein n=1 Tax=Aminobacter ciceronei TaxID=150723 RepID=UPI0015F80986|nr:hypothetical protein [Aminobacter ciceronei]
MPDLVAACNDDGMGLFAPAENGGLICCFHRTELSSPTATIRLHIIRVNKALPASARRPASRMGNDKKNPPQKDMAGSCLSKSCDENLAPDMITQHYTRPDFILILSTGPDLT